MITAMALLMTVCTSPGVGCYKAHHVATFYHEERLVADNMCNAFIDVMRQRGGATPRDNSGRLLHVTYRCEDERLIP